MNEISEQQQLELLQKINSVMLFITAVTDAINSK